MTRRSSSAQAWVAVLLCSVLCYAEASRRGLASTRQILAEAPHGSVSIYDGVLPSPDLGPRNPLVASTPAPSVALQVPVGFSTQHSGMRCDAGCIAGSVIGGTAGLVLLLGGILYCCCRRNRASVKDEAQSSALSTSDLELLDHQAVPAQGPASSKVYSIGEDVFCRKGRNCTFGKVLSLGKGDDYTVEFYDGNQGTVTRAYMAPNFTEGTEVWYTPPDGRPSVRGTVIQADGSYWPPFYQLTPHGGSVDLVNTTADCLVEAQKDGAPAHFISAKAG